MPVSHSHQLLCVSRSPLTTVDDQRRLLGRGHVPDLVRRVAEGAQHVDLVAVAFGQVAAVAEPRHLRAAGFRPAFLARYVREVFRVPRIGHVDDGGAVVLHRAGQRIQLRLAAVMADVGDPAAALRVQFRRRRRCGSAGR